MSKKTWKEIPRGGLILEAGNAATYKTGGWRTFRPVRDNNKCIHCLLCYIYYVFSFANVVLPAPLGPANM